MTDKIFYESYPYAQTRVENIYSMAKIFGVNAPKLETARVLELGCGTGGNLIPHALHFPKAKFIGIDPSAEQVDIANARIKELGLKNIEIKNTAITDIDKSFGEFDYIICHGVISTVPEKIRSAIFDICSKFLTPSGLAYISYNTLPGWNMVRSIRDMMLYHSQIFNDVEEKIAQSHLLLDFITSGLEGNKTPYAEILSAEAKILASQDAGYLYQTHLLDVNHQYYFHEFMKEAQQNKLQYLCDLELASMYLGNFPQKIAEKLKAVEDIVRIEQYMDFITNRRFRSTVLCRSTVKLKMDISSNDIKDLYFSMRISPGAAIGSVNLDDDSILLFFANNDQNNQLSTSDPIMKAMFYIFAENINYYLSADELSKEIIDKLPKNKYRIDFVKDDVLRNILELIFKGFVSLNPTKPNFIQSVSDKPQVSPLVRAQLKWNNGKWVTNEMHKGVAINVFDNYALRYLDGKHTKEQITEKLAAHVKDGEFNVIRGELSLTDDAVIKKELKACLESSLNMYAINGLLIN